MEPGRRQSKVNKMKFLGMAVLFAVVLAGCSGGDKTGTDESGAPGTKTSGGTGGKKFKLAFVTNNSSDYWTIARKGVEKAEGELGIKVDFVMPPDGTAAAQRKIVDDLKSKGVDGMAISPTDPANQTDMINGVAKDSLVFTQDSDAPKSDRACYIGTDNKEAGKQLGEELKKALPNGGKIYAFVGSIDAQNAKDRIDGVKEAIAGSKIVLVDTIQDGTDHTKAKTNVADILVKDPDVAACIGIWSYNGPAIYGAVQDAQKVGKVKILCFDEEDETLAGIKAGAIDATIVQQPFEFGYKAIINMSKYLNGDKSVIPANKLDIVPTLVIHKAEVEEFQTKLNKLRGRS